MMSKINTIDLFAGCGGLMEGFEKRGVYKTIACVEWEAAPCDNLVHRLETKWGYENAKRQVIRFDIQRTTELFNGFLDSEFGKHEGLDKLVGENKVDLIIGGPPCQAYSIAGRIRDENGMRDDYRNYLFESYLKVVEHYQPDFFLFENVAGMLSAMPDGTPIADRIRCAFDNAGYYVPPNFKDAMFNLPEYGIPQNRKRIIILGVRKKSFPHKYSEIIADFYTEIMPSLKRKKETVAKAIGDLPKWIPVVCDGKVNYVSDGKTVANHTPRHHSARDVEVFKLLTEDIAEKRFEYISIPKLKELYTKVTGKKSNIHKYYVLRNNQQSNTIPAHLYKDGFRHIHPDPLQCRTLTVREAARLQTFDDDYEFIGSMMHQYKMIGNAVPPRFSLVLAEALVQIYAKYTSRKISETSPLQKRDVVNHVKHTAVQLNLFDMAEMCAVSQNPLTLLGTYRTSARNWIVEKNFYNYPVTEEALDKYQELLAVRRLILTRQTDEPLYFAVRGYSIVSQAEVKALDYPIKPKHPSSTKYILYKLERLDEPIPIFGVDDVYIVGKGVEKGKNI